MTEKKKTAQVTDEASQEELPEEAQTATEPQATLPSEQGMLLEYDKLIPEARYICWFNMYGHKADAKKGEHEIQMNITVRGFEDSATFAEDIKNTVGNLRKALNLELYSVIRKPDPAGQPIHGTEQTANKPAPGTAVANKAAPGAKAQGNATPPSGSNGDKAKGSEKVTSVKIIPEPENRVTIELLRTGLKWPVLKISKFPIDRALELLPPGWSAEYLHEAEIYDVQWSANWVQGKPTGKVAQDGTPGYYKDITEIIDQAVA